MPVRSFFQSGFGRVAALLAAALFVLLVGCSANPGDPLESMAGAQSPADSMTAEAPAAGAQIALVSTGARLESSFGQTVWNTIARFAGENGSTSGQYKAEEDAGAALSTLELALRGGAELVFVMDETLSEAVAGSAALHPEVRFALLDAPADTQPASNVCVLGFSAIQAGWLAGYTAVYEEHSALGVVQGQDSRSAAWALGFVLGAEYAAEERQMEPFSLRLVWQNPTLRSRDSIALLAAQVYESEVGLAFAAVPAAQQQEAAEAARSQNGKLFGIDLELEHSGPQVLASLSFEPKVQVQKVLEAWQAGSLKTGAVLEGGVADGSILLEVEASRFENAGTWILAQAPLRFEDGTLAAQLARMP